MKALAVTGLGVVSPLGVGWDEFSKRLPDASVDPFSTASALFDMAPYEGARVAEVRGFDPAKHLGATGLRNNDRLTKLLLVAARLGLAHAGVKANGAWGPYGPDDVGVVAANAYGSLEAIHELNAVARLEDPRYVNPARFPNTVTNSSLGYVSIWEDLRAVNATVTNGPPGALDAVSCAELYLASGRAKAALVGGAEALSEPLILGLHRAGALDRDASTWAPGGDRSTGLRAGEGAALAVLEPLAAARARGATVHALALGYGTAFEPPEDDDRLFAPSREAMGRAIEAALRDASVAPAEVDVVAAGLSGWRAMDVEELAAVRQVMGPAACVAAPKARLGETLGGSGAFGVAAAAAWMGGAAVTGVAQGAAPEGVRTVLVTALGFHGNASALVVRRPE